MDKPGAGIAAELPYTDGDFHRFFWSSFSPKKASGVILDSRSSFPGYKDVLLASLLAWTVNPTNVALRRKVTVAAIMHKVIKAERLGAKGVANHNTADFTARHVRLGPRFISELYYGVGGLKSAYHADSAKQISRQFTAKNRQVMNATEVMRIFHFVHGQRPLLAKGSLSGAIRVFDEIRVYHNECYKNRAFKPFHDESDVKKAWGAAARSAPYLYAASHTMVSDQHSLLSELLAGRLKPNANAAWVAEWLAKTAFAATLLSDNYDRSAYKRCLMRTPECPPTKIPETGLSSTEEAVIRKIFSRT